MFKKLIGIVAAAILLSVSQSTLAANIVSDFDNFSFDGWTSTDGPASYGLGLNYSINPYFQVVDTMSGWTSAIAPSKFHGDWSSFISISADIMRVQDSFNVRHPFQFIISNGTDSAVYEFPKSAVELQNWNTLTAVLNQADWDVTGDWNSLISNVTDLRLRVDLSRYSHNEITGIDNVILAGAPTPAPEPTSMALGLMSLAGIIARRRKA